MLRLLLVLFPLLRLALWAGEPGDPGAVDPPPAGDPEPGDPTTPPAGGGDDRKFTQAEVDKFAGRARREALQRWAKENGFSDVKDLEAVIKAKKDADDQAKTDLTKDNERADREKARADTAEARLYDIVRKFGFQLAAVDQVADLELAYLAAQSLGLLNGDGPVEIDLETVSVKGMDKVIEKLIEKKPLLKKGPTAATPAGTGGAAGGVSVPAGQMTAQQKVDYQRRVGIR